MAAVQGDGARRGQVVLLRSAHELDGAGAHPVASVAVADGRTGVDVDAAAVGIFVETEEVVTVADERQQGQLAEGVGDVGADVGVGRQLRVHLVVGGGRAARLDEATPSGGESLGLGRLLDDRLGEDVGLRHGAPQRLAVLHLDGPDDGRLAEHDGRRVGQTLGRRL